MSDLSTVGLHFHIDKVENLVGFPTVHVEKDQYFWLLTRTSITSDNPEFYKYIEEISNYFFNMVKVNQNAVYQFLVLIHSDLSTDLYINDFIVAIEVLAKHDLEAFQPAYDKDIADIRRLTFPSIKINETDKVIYCLKVGWKFGLFFDLGRPEQLDISKMTFDLGTLYRKLSFQYVYEVLENEEQFEEMLKDGWFPFVEIIGNEYKALSKAYQDKFDFDNRIERFISSFDKTRIENITNKWWTNDIFKTNPKILKAGINAFLQYNDDGYINCIKTLLTEVEGIIRSKYISEKGIKEPFQKWLIYITEKGKLKSGSEYSLLLSSPFLKYLKDIVYPNFDIEKDLVDLSRHTISHGVAKAESYTKTRALQIILILDQIYFYI